MHDLIWDFCSSDQRFAHELVCSSHPASFRFHLTMDTLAFGYILPTTGRIRDFNPLETCAARRTTAKATSYLWYEVAFDLTWELVKKPRTPAANGTSRLDVASLGVNFLLKSDTAVLIRTVTALVAIHGNVRMPWTSCSLHPVFQHFSRKYHHLPTDIAAWHSVHCGRSVYWFR